MVAEVYARRLGSPLDSLLRLTDASGKVLAWNDDHEDKQMGLQTHYGDSYINAKLPKDGTYYVQLSDAQHHGGKEYGYRLRIGPPRPDFAVYVTPSSISVPVGRSVANLCSRISEKKDLTAILKWCSKTPLPVSSLSGGRIPGGRDRIRMTLTAPDDLLDEPVVLQLEGRAVIGGQMIGRRAIPAQDMMQAFVYQHLVPSQELMVLVLKTRRSAPSFELSGGSEIKIPAGGSAKARIKMWKKPMLKMCRSN